MSTPAWLIWLVCSAHAAAASSKECPDLCESFDVEGRQAVIQHRYQAFADNYEQDFTAKPDQVAVCEKQTQLENHQKTWLYATLTWIRKSCSPATHVAQRSKSSRTVLDSFKEKNRVSDAEVLVDGIGYLATLARPEKLN